MRDAKYYKIALFKLFFKIIKLYYKTILYFELCDYSQFF